MNLEAGLLALALDWAGLLALGLLLVVPLLFRKWLVARVEKGVQFKFDQQIEKLRTEQRIKEETFKADLRNKETEFLLCPGTWPSSLGGLMAQRVPSWWPIREAMPI